MTRMLSWMACACTLAIAANAIAQEQAGTSPAEETAGPTEAASEETGAAQAEAATTTTTEAAETAEAAVAETVEPESEPEAATQEVVEAEAVAEPTEEQAVEVSLGEEPVPPLAAVESEIETEAGDGEEDVALEEEQGSLHLGIPGYYQLSIFGMGDMRLGPADPDGVRPFPRELGQGFYGWGRLRATPELIIDSLTIRAQFDVMTGILFGDSTVGVDAAVEPRMRETPGSEGEEGGELVGIRPFDFRQLYIEWDTGYGILRAGQQASNWGLGVLSNNGDSEQVFGYNRYGDLAERIIFATKPLYTATDSFMRDLVVAVGGDLVYRDHLADLWAGDMAWQAILAVLLKQERDSAGIYVAYRNQEFDDGDTLEVVAVDAAFDWQFDLAESWYLQIAGEGVGVFGTTTAAASINHDSHDIQQFGGAFRIAAKYLEMVTTQVEVGAATNDADPLDDRILRFTFDPDYNVGLIMFEELLAWQTARAATMGGSPDLVGQPPPGLDLLSTNGGVSGAVYLNPTVRVKPWEWFDAAVGVLWAMSTSDVVSPFEEKVSGAPVNYVGGDSTSRNLGTEIDVAVNFHVPLRLVTLHAGAQFGYLFVGDAFADAGGDRGDDIWLTEGRLSLTF